MVEHKIQKSYSFFLQYINVIGNRILFVDITEIHFCFCHQRKKYPNRGDKERERERERGEREREREKLRRNRHLTRKVYCAVNEK